MEIIAGLIELDLHSDEKINDWADFINNNISLAIKSLSDEGTYIESFFYIELNEKPYLLTYQRVINFMKSKEIFQDSENEADIAHKKFKECWKKGYRAKLLVDLVSENNRRESKSELVEIK